MANGALPLRGVAFPFRIDARSGGVAATEGPRKLTENLQHLLLTRIGERLMLRDYGGGASLLVQENINDGLLAVARQQIGAAMLRYEPRALPQDISVLSHEGELFVRIQYLQAEVPGLQSTAIRIGG
ncbi:MAG: GPW/gp25 family protein [Gaiellaceae bacterium]